MVVLVEAGGGEEEEGRGGVTEGGREAALEITRHETKILKAPETLQ